MKTEDTLDRPFRLGLDVDGVLADFTTHFLALLAELTGRTVPADYVQTTWSKWGDYRASEVSLAWQHTASRPFWWTEHRPLDTPDMTVRQFLAPLWMYKHKLDVTFITTRPAPTARMQTIHWLTRQGMINPQVLVARSGTDKGELAAMLGLDLMVDDYWVNLQAVNAAAGYCGTQTVLYRQPYNVDYASAFACVTGLGALWALIEKTARLPSFTYGSDTRSQAR